jgi:SAM-dependent methyltransferase
MPEQTPDYIAFDRVADLYEATRRIPPTQLRQAAELILSDSGLTSEQRFLDAGVGTGRFARHLAAAGARVVGIDISTPMLNEAARLAPGLPLVCGDLRRLPFADGAFAGALVVHILHLISAWHTVVAEIRRVIVSGGPLYIATESGPRLPTVVAYFQAAQELGIEVRRPGAANLDAILAHLADSGWGVRQIDTSPISWMNRATVAETLAVLPRQPYSHLFHLSPAEHSRILRRLDQKLADAGVTPETIEEVEAGLQLWCATWQEGASDE